MRNAFVDAAWGMLQERRRKTVSSTALQQKEMDRLQAECAKLIAEGSRIGGNLESLVAELAAVEQQLKKVRKKMSQKDDADDVVTSCGSKTGRREPHGGSAVAYHEHVVPIQ